MLKKARIIVITIIILMATVSCMRGTPPISIPAPAVIDIATPNDTSPIPTESGDAPETPALNPTATQTPIPAYSADDTIYIDETGGSNSELYLNMPYADLDKWIHERNLAFETEEGDADNINHDLTIWCELGFFANTSDDYSYVDLGGTIEAFRFYEPQFSTLAGLRVGDTFEKMVQLYDSDYEEEYYHPRYSEDGETEHDEIRYKYDYNDSRFEVRTDTGGVIIDWIIGIRRESSPTQTAVP